VSESDLSQAQHSLQERLQQPRVARRRGLVAAVVVAVLVTVMALWWEARQDPRALRPASTITQSALGSPTTGNFPAGPDGPETVPTVGFIGLPPPGAVPSSPEYGVLVDEWPLFGGSLPWRGGAQLYEDGRLIWFLFHRGTTPPYVQQSTGYLEQRLSPEGVDLVRRSDGVSRDPWRLGAWLPATAWQDITIRPYVPSRFGACVSRGNPNAPVESRVWGRPGEPQPLADLLALLPPRAAELLRGQEPVPPLGDDETCLDLSTGEARDLNRALLDGDMSQDESQNRFVMQYEKDLAGPDRLDIRLEPVYPDGSVGCSSCG
jgi:hypothetical protein